jgi:hypothetical protein
VIASFETSPSVGARYSLQTFFFLAGFTEHIMRRVIWLRRFVDGDLSNQEHITLLIFVD